MKVVKRSLWLLCVLVLVLAPDPLDTPEGTAPPSVVVQEAAYHTLVPPRGMVPVYFLKGRAGGSELPALHRAYRPEGPRTPKHSLALLLQGPTAEERLAGVWSALPARAQLERTRGGSEELIVDLSDAGGPDTEPRAAAQVAATLYPYHELDAVRVTVRGRAVRAILRAQFLNPTFAVRPEASNDAVRPQPGPERRPAGAGAARDARREQRRPRFRFLSLGLLPWRKPAPPAPARAEKASASMEAAGPLAGKVIVISPGHGLTRFASGKWRYQRGYFGGMVEDEVNVRFAIQAARELRRLGARVHVTRPEMMGDERGSSGEPRWTEAARYYLRDIGLPDWVYQAQALDFNADIDCRPLYANYLRADLLISVHNNDGPNTGTMTLYDTTNGFATESRRLSLLLQRHVVSEIRSDLGIRWKSLGAIGSNARYGENHWAQVPSAILEIAFMNRKRDRQWIASPDFQRVVGQGVAGAVAEYFGASVPAQLPPPPPARVEPVVRPWPADPPVVACLGDPVGSEEIVYASLLQARLDGRLGPGRRRVVCTLSGSETVEGMLARWGQAVESLRPAYVLVAPGRSELVKDASGHSRVPIERFEGALAELVRRTRALGALPALATIPPIDDARFYARHPRVLYASDGGVQSLRDRYNAAIRRVARRTHAPLADVSRAAYRREGEWLPAEVSTTQSELSPVGLERLVRMMLQALQL